MLSIVLSVCKKIFTIKFNLKCFIPKYFHKPHDESPFTSKIKVLDFCEVYALKFGLLISILHVLPATVSSFV